MHTTLQSAAGLALLAIVGISQASDDALPASKPRAIAPLMGPKAPEVHGKGRTDVDRFILAALEAKNLSLNPEADRTTLIRRVAFDLTGLPPTVVDIQTFAADRSPDAYEKMVERYLASERYGERWGKYWLDAAGYADSNGYFSADSDRPLAWKYRDYVIRSFNADKPYDQFVREQLAGDELAGYVPGQEITPAMVEGLTATHFLRNAPDGTGESDGNPDEVRTDRFSVLEGNVQTIMNCLFGLTVQCARCHDHKFEPLTQEEYYSLQAILFPVYNPEKWIKPNDRVVAVGPPGAVAEQKHRNILIDRQVKAARDGLATFADSLREELLDDRLKDLDEPTRKSVIEVTKTPDKKRTPAQAALLKKHKAEITDDEIARRFPEYAALRDRVHKTIAERERARPKPPDLISAFVETDPKPPAHHLLKRGQHNQPGLEVPPGVPAALCLGQNEYRIAPPARGISSGRRSAFAAWATSPENPLLARVIVNRIWQHHFGTGLVATPDNLGASGAKPSHPSLLDYLAAELVKSGWSVKALHRLLLSSAVYRQSSALRAGLDAVDPDNRLLSHYPLRRLDAEAIRDAMLQVAGELDLHAGGPYVPSKRTGEGVVEVSESTPGAHRRSIYLQQRRSQVVTFLQLFDAPSIVGPCGKRSPSTVPLQSLSLLNSEFARGRAKAFAARLDREAGGDDAKRLAVAYELTIARLPSAEERLACADFLDKQRAVYTKEKDPGSRAWIDLCQLHLASNAFLYVE